VGYWVDFGICPDARPPPPRSLRKLPDLQAKDMSHKCALAFFTRLPARGVAVLVLLFAALVAPSLRAQTSVAYSVGTVPFALAFDGANMWVANQSSNNVTKLLASTGATVGT
jgi:hypothetical protein